MAKAAGLLLRSSQFETRQRKVECRGIEGRLNHEVEPLVRAGARDDDAMVDLPAGHGEKITPLPDRRVIVSR